MTAADRRSLQARIDTVPPRPRKRRDLAALGLRLAALEEDAPLAARNRLRLLRRRFDHLAGNLPQSWMTSWMGDYDHLHLAVRREEVGNA